MMGDLDTRLDIGRKNRHVYWVVLFFLGLFCLSLFTGDYC